MNQPRDPLAQLWLASVHLAAATLAFAWGITHLVAVAYHIERINRMEAEDTADHADAYLRGGA